MERSQLCCSCHAGVNRIDEFKRTEQKQRLRKVEFDRSLKLVERYGFCLICCAVKTETAKYLSNLLHRCQGKNKQRVAAWPIMSGVNEVDVFCYIRFCSLCMKSAPLSKTKAEHLDILPVCCSQTHPPF